MSYTEGQLEQLWWALAPNSSPNKGTPIRMIEFMLSNMGFTLRFGLPTYSSYRKQWLRERDLPQAAGSEPVLRARIKNCWKRHISRALVREGIFAEMPPETPEETDEPRYWGD